MNCIHCGEELEKARIMAGGIKGGGGFEVFLEEPEKKGVFQEHLRSSVSCYVCKKCGNIELVADSPETLFQ